MDFTSVFAILFGVMFTVLGVSYIMNKTHLKGIMDELVKSKCIQLIFGLIPLLIGSVVVILHNNWGSNDAMFVSFIGWALLISGIYRIVFVEHWIGLVQRLESKTSLMNFAGVLMGLIGLYCLYIGLVV